MSSVDDVIAADEGVHIAFSPVTGGPLGRSVRYVISLLIYVIKLILSVPDRGGRNWEGWFADPYATGEASYVAVKGLQDQGVRAVSKHVRDTGLCYSLRDAS